MLHVCLDDSPSFRLIELHETGSTNSFLRTYRPPVPSALTVATAEFQTAGRGQVGNTWESAQGQNLLCSMLFAPYGVVPAESFVANQAIALAVRDAAQEFITERVVVKWPNDIYVGNEKLAGILIETEMSGQHIARMIAGIGMNVNQTSWSDNVPNPTSLRLLSGNELLVRNVLEQLVGHAQHRIAQLERGDYEGIRNDYRAHLFRGEGFYLYSDANGEFTARIAEIKNTGHLVLETPGGEQRCYDFKEVEVRF